MKNASGGYYIVDLFLEGMASKSLPPREDVTKYSTSDEHRVVNHKGKDYPSLYFLYMEMEDPTEWEFSQKYFSSWDHWQAVASSAFFRDTIASWRRQLEIKHKARAIQAIKTIADDATNKNHYDAQKFLIRGEWYEDLARKEKESGSLRGRPSKDSIKEKVLADIQKEKDKEEKDFRLLKQLTGFDLKEIN